MINGFRLTTNKQTALVLNTLPGRLGQSVSHTALREWSTEVHVIDVAANKKRNALTGRQPSSLQSGQSFLARLHLPPETLTQHGPILVAT